MKVVTLIHKGKVKTISIDDLKKMKIELTQAWESLCRKCGKCCFVKSTNKNGVVFINYDKPCWNLKFMGKRAECSVYPDRFTKCEQCNTIPESIHNRYLPADCPYVKSAASYKAPVDNGEWYKRARRMLTGRYDYDSMYSGGDQPTGGTRNMPAKLPPRITSQEEQNPTREDLAKPKDWKFRRLQQRLRAKGKIGALDPREKTNYNIKPSGHQLGG